MKVNFLEAIQDLNHKPVLTKDKDAEGKEIERSFTLRDMAVTALLAKTADAAKLEGLERQRRTHLADRIYGAKAAIVLTPEEGALLKALINEHYGQQSILFVGRAWDLLDGKTDGPDPEPEN